MPRDSVGTWSGDTFTAVDGRVFGIFSEHVRGEPRWYEARRQNAGQSLLPGERRVYAAAPGSERWIRLPFDGAESKATVKRAVERYVRNTLEEHAAHH